MKKRIVCLLVCTALCLCLAPPASAENVKLAAFTFDDGPSAAYTPVLLDGLAQRNVKATFFFLGSYVELYPEIVKQVYEAGHQLASHTYSHNVNLNRQTTAVIQDEVRRTAEALTAASGDPGPFLVRLPGGNGYNDQRVLNALGAPSIFWSVDPTNGGYPNPYEKLYAGLLRQMHDGAIILLHDAHGMANINAALDAIDTLQAQGYEFVTLNELFRLKGVTPQNGVNYFSVYNPEPQGYDESRLAAHWAWDDLDWCREQGILQGDGVGLKPNAWLTRAMAVTLLYRAAGGPEALAGEEPDSSGAGFPDVPETEWYAQAVAWARRAGLVEGYDDGSFRPGEVLTREQLYAVAARWQVRETDVTGRDEAENIPADGGALPRYGDDARISVWAQPYVMELRAQGFVSGNDVELFRPHDAATRADACEIIHWLLDAAVPSAAL